MAHKLLIIQPSNYLSKRDRTVLKVRRRRVVPLTLPYLAALTPEGWDITLVDEQLHPVPFDERFDVAAVSCATLTSFRAYDVADEFRRRGVPVLLGGPHTFFHSEEAGEHCDAVGIGEAEPIWATMIEDALHGRLARLYRAEQLPDLAGLPPPRYDLLDLRRYRPFETFTIVSSRGCPFQCEFCSERFLLGDSYRCRPVPEVIEEIKRCSSRNIFFGDSNFGGKRSHAMELMEAMVPLRLRWSALWPSYLCNDNDFMDLAQRSGLLHLNIGLESISPETLAGMNKTFNKTHKYADMLANLRRRGISYSLNFIFGWDGEVQGVFDATLKFLYEHKVPVAYFNILTPIKGTPLYERMRSQGRILDEKEVGRWPGQICYLRPPYGTPASFENHVRNLYRDFYSLPSMVSRLPMPLTQSNIASWVINFSQRRMARGDRSLNNFDGY
ncbi:MAG: B12-binding domain-containing radical SAM protein [Limisphaerales bacterium]